MIDAAGIEIPENALRGSHLFRHTFASGLLSEGESIKNISDMLGHKQLSTTLIYTKIDLENLKEVCLIWREKMKINIYKSILKDRIFNFINFKQEQGYKLKVNNMKLNILMIFC